MYRSPVTYVMVYIYSELTKIVVHNYHHKMLHHLNGTCTFMVIPAVVHDIQIAFGQPAMFQKGNKALRPFKCHVAMYPWSEIVFFFKAKKRITQLSGTLKTEDTWKVGGC